MSTRKSQRTWRGFQRQLPQLRVVRAEQTAGERRARRRERWQSLRGLLFVVVLALVAATAAVLFTMAVVR